MLKSVLIIVCGALHALSLYGFGRHFQKFDGLPHATPWPISMVLGLGCWIFIGGLLNLFGLAYPWALYALVGAGLLLALIELRRAPSEAPRSRRKPRDWVAVIAPSLLVIVAVTLFISATLIPSAAFNVGDDFRRYLAYPLRMLQSGTLAGSPLSSLGATTFGGQSLLQGFLLGYAPPAYVNGFDLLFCLVLCMLLLLEFGDRLGTPPALIFFAVLSLVFINPQYVNVTSLYSGSIFLTALILFTVTRARLTGRDRRSDTFTGLVIALFYSSLIVLKTTFWLFLAMHFALFMAALWLATRDAGRATRIALTVILASAFFISPWVLLFLPNYLTAIQSALAPAASLPALASLTNEPLAITQPPPLIVNLLSPETLFYGSSFAAYTFAACLAVYYGLFAWLGTGTRTSDMKEKESKAVYAGACAAVFAAYPVYVYFGGLRLPGDGSSTWLRYFCPILIGSIPVILLLAGSYATIAATRSGRPGLTAGLLSLPALALLCAFFPSLNDRIHQASNYGSILAFSSLAQSRNYLLRNASVLDGPARGEVEKLQAMVPPEERLVAWISAPQYLNYARNRILDVDSAGLAAAGAAFPGTLRYADAKRYFQSLGVKYILWEHGPDAEQATDILQLATASSAYDRRIGINSLYFRRMLEIVSRHRSDAGDRYDNVIYYDPRHVLLRIDG